MKCTKTQWRLGEWLANGEPFYQSTLSACCRPCAPIYKSQLLRPVRVSRMWSLLARELVATPERNSHDLPAGAPSWEPTSAASSCPYCGIEFTFWNRKVRPVLPLLRDCGGRFVLALSNRPPFLPLLPHFPVFYHSHLSSRIRYFQICQLLRRHLIH